MLSLLRDFKSFDHLDHIGHFPKGGQTDLTTGATHVASLMRATISLF